MKKLTSVNYEVTNGCSFSGLYLDISLEELIDLLGQPSFVGSGDNKAQLEWVYYEGDKVFSIYDYKSDRLIHEITRWHVGRRNLKKDELRGELENLGIYSTEDVYPNRD